MALSEHLKQVGTCQAGSGGVGGIVVGGSLTVFVSTAPGGRQGRVLPGVHLRPLLVPAPSESPAEEDHLQA